MVEPDYDFFATRPPSDGDVPAAPVPPARFTAMPTPGPAPMAAWNPDPVLAAAPPHLAPPRSLASSMTGAEHEVPHGTATGVLVALALAGVVLVSVLGAVLALGR